MAATVRRWRGLALFVLIAVLGRAAELKSTRLNPPAIKTAPGYEVTLIHAVDRASHGSWVSLTADPRGRLYASDQYGPLYRITLPTAAGGETVVAPVPLPIGGAHGLTWIDGSLYAVVGEKIVCATGLYRLRDTDADGELDRVELLRALAGEGEHAPHAVAAAPDGRSLYVIAGNATRLPELVRSRVPRLWADDSLLRPLPALMGSETRGVLPGGWICRTDLDGREWELHCAGFRNAYAVACDAQGELFTFDSDTEFEINLPWYRPTRVLHAVSGADFGWRRGALKIPDAAGDAWPVLLPMGLGSPTAVLFAPGAKVAPAQRGALWLADWSYGKIYALNLQPTGATFTATRTEIVSATPLPVTAMCVNPVDGALYFTTGGRRMHSALYRLRWTGAPSQPVATLVPPTAGAVTRHALEVFHGREDTSAVALAWPAMASPDLSLRQAARTAIESQPVAAWRSRALKETEPRAALTALLALARTDAPGSRTEIFAALRRLHERGLDPSLCGDWLRVLSLTFSRGGASNPTERAAWIPIAESLLGTTASEHGPALIEFLVFCDAPSAATRGLAFLRASPTRQAQLDVAKSLCVLRQGWTPTLRQEFFSWLAQTTAWRGGGTFKPFLQRLRNDALECAPAGEREALSQLLAAPTMQAAGSNLVLEGRRTVREWTTEDIVMLVDRDSRRRDPVRGRQIFGAVGCFSCHSSGGEGGAVGPDLTGAGQRLAVRDLVEAIVEPSREISDQYGTVLVTLRDGRRLSGRIVNQVEDGLHLAEDLTDPSNVKRLVERDIVSIEPSRVSLMPPGLLNLLVEDEILDLLAFLRRP